MNSPQTHPQQVADWYLVREIDANLFWVNEPGHVSFYVFRYGEQGLFIDSGLGLSRELGGQLLAHLGIKDFKVYCTHAHCDHIGLNSLARDIYLSEVEWQKFGDQGEANQLFSYHSLLKTEKKWPTKYNIEKKDQWQPTGFITAGSRFEFGPWKFKTIEGSGHTAGSLIYLEETQNNLFLGDFIYSGTLYFHFKDSQFSSYVSSLKNLIQIVAQSKLQLWPSHNQIPLESKFLMKTSGTIDKILNKTITPTKIWPKDTMFEYGVIFENEGIRLVLRKDEYDSL